MSRHLFTSLIITAGCVCVSHFQPQCCLGQVQTLTSSSNSQSTRSSSQSIGGSTSSLGGSSGLAQSPLNNTQTPLSSGTGTPQNLNAQNSFIGRSDTTQNAFIGRNNTQSATGGAPGQTRNFNRATTGGSQNSLNQRNAGQTGPKVPEFRPQLRVAFTAPPIPVGNVSTSMGSSFDRLKTRHEKLNGVQFQVNADHSVTLRGQVDSSGTRKLVEFLAMLEPGVRKVNNELTISGQK
ncbi:BON domain-containing protein [Gimesia panareensis]|uniref:BON domain-containing protein n=1 Tax=Gimesia panareensis TaxID=2527978 RepID=UPI00118A0843|nr:BON domain-containing protein [Gimesia panareensis]QDU52786.1 BON domain protein [Gimesia panareensis]